MALSPGWLPEPAPLAMPAQDLWRRPLGVARAAFGESDWLQVGVFILAGLVALFGGATAYTVVQIGGLTVLEWINLVLFQILFAWIAYALASALLGFGTSFDGGARGLSLSPEDPTPTPLGRTAILMPVHNEDPEGVFARLGNIDRSIRALGASGKFDMFVLSDTRDPQIKRQEVLAFDRLHRASSGAGRLFYRARTENRGRKAGNIADWVRGFGGAYPYMVVLDADSVMDGETLVRLAAFMDAHPRTGLVQTVPRLVNRMSVFGRVQQFASRLYGPMLSEGLAHTCGTAGNYWGHNAIIRVEAFAAHAGLPHLRGPRPLGGEILSHDFVEAALLRRAGWDIRLAPHLGGSYEECPPSLPDMIVRERRWCQGNLQHLPLIGARGLHWMSRVHLAQGVLTYLMPPLWLMFLVVGVGVSAQARGAAASAWDDYNIDLMKWLWAVSLVSLFIPRVLALFRALVRQDERSLWGDPLKLMAGVVFETALSALMAPVMMAAQCKALFDIILGRDSGWPAAQRTDGSLTWGEATRRHLPFTVFGVLLGAATLLAAPGIVFWMMPVILGLVLSIPLAVLTSDPKLGRRLLAEGVFVTPEERTPPQVLAGLQNLEPPMEVYIRRAGWRLVLDRLFDGAGEPVEASADA